MRQEIDAVAIGLRRQHAEIVIELLPVRFVVVDIVHLAADDLKEPDGGRIADAEIPSRVHRHRLVIRHIGDAALPLRFRQIAAEIGADDRGIEGAFEFLRVLLRGHVALRVRELSRRQQAGVGGLEHHREPVSDRPAPAARRGRIRCGPSACR